MIKSGVLALLLAIASSAVSYSQTGEMSGQVIDAKTLEPLPFANVYINNTTIGTTTNATGEFLLRNIPVGQTEIVFSYVGYQPLQTRIAVIGGRSNLGVVKLVYGEKQLSEVEIKGSRDKIWDRQFRKFQKVFLGDGHECTIKNPWVIDFSEEGKTLLAKASAPLEIENKGLGYQLFFQLKDFRFSGDRYSIIGNTRFEEILAQDARQAVQWKKNRERVYIGSAKHLMKAILEKKMMEEGFRLYADKIRGSNRSTNFSYEMEHNLIPYDTSTIVSPGTVPGEYRMHFKDRIEVHYIYELSKSIFYKDISHSLSWIEVKGDYIRVDKNGTLLNPTDVVISGDMTEGRVASMIPLDYVRGGTIQIQSRETLSAKRLQEKVYLHLDKPYYYPGENIWFSGYMSYRVPGMQDSLSRVLYVDLFNSKRELVNSLTLPIDSGRVIGSFKIPVSPPEGTWTIRAYTNWMRNYGVEQFFYKAVPVLNLLDKVDESSAAPLIENEKVKVTFSRPFYHTRDKIEMRVVIKDAEGNPVKTSLSVSVTDMQQVTPVSEQKSIVNCYAQANDLPEGMLPVFKYPVERGITVAGRYLNKKGKGEKTSLTIVQDGFENIYQVTTNDNGEFSLKNLLFLDSVKFAIQSGIGKVVIKKKDDPIFPTQSIYHLSTSRTESPQRILSSYDFSDAIMLKEVQINAEKIPEVRYENPYGKPDYYIKGESLVTFGTNLATAISGKIPGYRLVYYEFHWYLISTRGEFTRVSAPSEPLVYIDGAQVLTGGGQTMGDRLHDLNPAMIDHIEVSSMINSNVGASGANGLIAVFTKRAEPAEFKALPTFKVKGFDTALSFQAPDYENPTTDTNLTDYRSTLYWNPQIDLSNGGAIVNFFASDLTGKYRVVIEGVTGTGIPLRAESTILIQE